MLLAESHDFFADLGESGIVVLGLHAAVDDAGHFAGIFFVEATSRDSGSTETDTGRIHRLARIERNRRTAAGDADLFHGHFSFLTGNTLGGHVHHDEVVVGAIADDLVAELLHFGAESLSVLDDVLGVGLEFRLQSFEESNGLTGVHVVMRTTLHTREHALVDFLGQRNFLEFALDHLLDGAVLAHDDSRTRATECLVGGGRHDVEVRHRRFDCLTGNETCNVRNVSHGEGANFVGDFLEALPVEVAAVGRETGEDHLRLFAESDFANLFHVDAASFLIDFVLHEVVKHTREVHRMAVRKVSTVVELEAEDLVTRLKNGKVNSSVCRRTGKRLDIHVVATKELLATFDSEGFHLVDNFVTAVVTLAHITFTVLVGQHGAHGFHDGLGGVVFGSDELDAVFLAFGFFLNDVVDFRICLLQCRFEHLATPWYFVPPKYRIFYIVSVMPIILFVVFLASIAVFAQDTPGAFKIDSIQYTIGDAFDDSRYHTKYDKWALDLLNWIHIETRESTVKKLLLFNEGETVTETQIQEAERFLRKQNFLSDASINITSENGKNIANVKTSDNWTLAVPTTVGFSGNKWSYSNLNWGIGVQESNFLGLGQLLGFYFGHDEFRDMWKVEYGAPHFLFRYNHLDLLYSYNTDGYLAYGKMYIPFLSRSQNQWAYTIEGIKNKHIAYFYGSGELPPGATVYDAQKKYKDSPIYNHKKALLDSFQLYNGNDPVKLMAVKDFIDDSLSFRVSRSFGGTYRKLYAGATYDYHYTTASEGKLYPYAFTDGDTTYAIDSVTAVNEWLPERKDSRLGFYLTLSNIRYEKIKNFHNAKWTEDIEKGYELKAQISKNYEQIGAADNDIRLDFWANLMLGRDMHHLTLKSEMNFYLDHGEKHDYYGKISGEYIFHPTNTFATALSGLADFYEDARYGKQLTLGGVNGFAGFPTGFYAGQARVFANLEQRYFTNFEIATLMPVFVVFQSIGETAWDFWDINRKDLVYLTGFGLRFAQTKSISRLVNKMDVSIPLNGVRKGEPHYSIITTYSL